MAQQYVGIDLHRRRSVIVRMTEAGEVVDEVRIDNDPVALASEVAKAGENPEVVLEAAYGWYWAADVLELIGATVHLAHPLGVKAYAHQRVKNDAKDAKTLADLARMNLVPEAWIAPHSVRDLRELVRYRAKLVAMRTSLKAQVHAVLAKDCIRVPMSDLFGVKGNRLLDDLRLSAPSAAKVTSLRDLIAIFDEDIAGFDDAIHDAASMHRGYRCVQTVPGVGPVLGAVLVAEIGEVQRFTSPTRLCSWAGLTPRHSRVRPRRPPRGDHQARLQAREVGSDRGGPEALPQQQAGGRLHAHRQPARQQDRKGCGGAQGVDARLLRAQRRQGPIS
jgi:transposase